MKLGSMQVRLATTAEMLPGSLGAGTDPITLICQDTAYLARTSSTRPERQRAVTAVSSPTGITACSGTPASMAIA
jgi:hypothetical protein